LYITDDYIVTHNSGKSAMTAITALRELLVPFSNTIILAPTYKNASVIFGEVLKHVYSLALPIKTVNKGQFSLELENGSKLSALTETNYESGLGQRVSLFIVDESASILDLMRIYEAVFVPTFLDFSAREDGTLYAKSVFLGTPRLIGSVFHNLYLRGESRPNWVSFNSPSTCNPLLPRSYIEQQEQLLPPHIYKTEILAQFIQTGSGVFFAFDPEQNLYDPDEVTFSKDSVYVTGHDFGHTDSTAQILVYTDRAGNYFVHDTYQAAAKPTKDHVQSFKDLERRNVGILDERYGDPSAAQTILDLRTQYDYDIQRANNKVAPGIACINDLMAPQGYDKKPKLFINKNLGELIRQVKMVTYKESKSSTDPFERDPEGTHWDLLAALRYAVYTHYIRNLAGIAIV
jgi:hypothetical protein